MRVVQRRRFEQVLRARQNPGRLRPFESLLAADDHQVGLMIVYRTSIPPPVILDIHSPPFSPHNWKVISPLPLPFPRRGVLANGTPYLSAIRNTMPIHPSSPQLSLPAASVGRNVSLTGWLKQSF